MRHCAILGTAIGKSCYLPFHRFPVQDEWRGIHNPLSIALCTALHTPVMKCLILRIKEENQTAENAAGSKGLQAHHKTRQLLFVANPGETILAVAHRCSWRLKRSSNNRKRRPQ